MTSGKSVKVYSTPTCPYCHKVKEYLKQKNVHFTDFDVASDQQARQAMIQKSGQMGVPVIEVDGEIVVGFNPAKLDSLLG